MVVEVVLLRVSCPLTKVLAERRYETTLTVKQLKEKLELVSGILGEHQVLDLLDVAENVVAKVNNDSYYLKDYPVADGMTLKVTTTGPPPRTAEEESGVPKFELTDAEYDKRTDTVRDFKRRMKLGRFGEEEAGASASATSEEQVPQMNVGQRCLVTVLGLPPRLGTVRFVGQPHFKPGWWIGVEYDEPVGKNDGSVEGKRYFQCATKYGGFVVPASVMVGDFPPETYDDDDEM